MTKTVFTLLTLKKVVQWYNILQKNDLLNTIEEEETADISEEE